MYKTFVKPIAFLSEDEIQNIVKLYLSYYDGSDAAQVVSDLKKKTEVLLLYHNEVLVGFTSFELYEFFYEGVKKQIIYSGDTIVHQKHWGQQALSRAWIRYIGQLKQLVGNTPIYWFLIVKGHRTYKFLPAFTKSFFPHWEVDRSDLKPLLDALAKEKFAELYDEKSGLIRFERSMGHLKQEIAVISDNELKKDSVSFFVRSNPNYHMGDELACICEFDDANLRALTKRILYTQV